MARKWPKSPFRSMVAASCQLAARWRVAPQQSPSSLRQLEAILHHTAFSGRGILSQRYTVFRLIA